VRIRHDAVFISSIFFTIALLWLAPTSVNMASVTRDMNIQAFGFSLSAIILIGLIVTWAGFVNRVRWAWFVMFVIVWVWVFPWLILPFFAHKLIGTWGGVFSDAWQHAGLGRDDVEEISIFSLMLIALILPIKSFFSRHATG
jgi:hypothetical protein